MKPSVCPLDISPETLSDYRSRMLDSATTRLLDEHIPTCGVCQAILAAYDRIAQDLRAQRVPPTGAQVWRDLQPSIAAQRGVMTKSQKTLALTGLVGAAAIVTLFALIFVQLAGKPGNNHPLTVANTATAYPTEPPRPTEKPVPTITPTPITTPCAISPQGQMLANGVGLEGALQGPILPYPDNVLPSSLSLAPLEASKMQTTGQANPKSGAGVTITICNTGTKAHVVQAIYVRIAAFTPITQTLNTFNPCGEGSTYTRQGGVQHNPGCGGSYGGVVAAEAQFNDSVGAGAITQVTQKPEDLNAAQGLGLTLLPVTLVPGQELPMTISIKQPSSMGAYTFDIGVTLDGQSTKLYSATQAPAQTFATARQWDGQACLNANMQSQIPANDLTTAYVCPEA